MTHPLPMQKLAKPSYTKNLPALNRVRKKLVNDMPD